MVVGYSRYLTHIAELIEDKEIVSSGMTHEKERCAAAIERAAGGAVVSLVSSGDPGVYGMAGLALEMAERMVGNLEIEIVPGVTAANSAAAALGAPLMLDYAVISLSDLLVPWETIRRRLEATAAADMVTALYNPRSARRVRQLDEAVEIFLRHRSAETVAGVATAVGRPEERVVVTVLGALLSEEINMASVVMIGNSQSRMVDGRFVTPRGYPL